MESKLAEHRQSREKNKLADLLCPSAAGLRVGHPPSEMVRTVFLTNGGHDIWVPCVPYCLSSVGAVGSVLL